MHSTATVEVSGSIFGDMKRLAFTVQTRLTDGLGARLNSKYTTVAEDNELLLYASKCTLGPPILLVISSKVSSVTAMLQ